MLTRSHESLISGSSSFTLCRNCPFSFSRETILSLALTCRCSRLRRRISRLCISYFDSSILTVYQRVWLGVWIVTGVVIWKRELGTTTHFFSNGSSGVFEPLSGRGSFLVAAASPPAPPPLFFPDAALAGFCPFSVLAARPRPPRPPRGVPGGGAPRKRKPPPDNGS